MKDLFFYVFVYLIPRYFFSRKESLARFRMFLMFNYMLYIFIDIIGTDKQNEENKRYCHATCHDFKNTKIKKILPFITKYFE